MIRNDKQLPQSTSCDIDDYYKFETSNLNVSELITKRKIIIIPKKPCILLSVTAYFIVNNQNQEALFLEYNNNIKIEICIFPKYTSVWYTINLLKNIIKDKKIDKFCLQGTNSLINNGLQFSKIYNMLLYKLRDINVDVLILQDQLNDNLETNSNIKTERAIALV